MPEQLDYCQCNRGPVIGVVHFNAERVWFFSMESHQARTHHEAADLRCVDCLADAALAVATGAIRDQMQDVARQRAAEIDAARRRTAMREGAADGR